MRRRIYVFIAILTVSMVLTSILLRQSLYPVSINENVTSNTMCSTVLTTVSGEDEVSMNELPVKLISLTKKYLSGNSSVANELMSLIDNYIGQNHTPVIVGDEVLFIYIGRAEKVYVAGDWNGWNPGSDPMVKLGESYWILLKQFPLDARFDYKFVVDNKWFLDPYNPRTCLGGFGPNSEFAMPKHVYPPWFNVPENISHGKLETIYVTDATGRNHRVDVYYPPVNNSRINIIIYFYDGIDYIELGKAHRILDYLIIEKKLPPAYAVFVSPSSKSERISEYGVKLDDTANFLIEKIVPQVENKLGIDNPYRVLVGDSLAGLIATYTMLKRPDMFKAVIAQSPAYWYAFTKLETVLDKSDSHNNTIYIHYGVYEGREFIKAIENLVLELRSKGYNVVSYSVNQGHSWCHWKEELGKILLNLLKA